MANSVCDGAHGQFVMKKLGGGKHDYLLSRSRTEITLADLENFALKPKADLNGPVLEKREKWRTRSDKTRIEKLSFCVRRPLSFIS